MDIKTTTNLKSPIYKDSVHIRKIVFIEEQNVPAEIELDDMDDQTIHYTGYVNNQAVCTLRILFKDEHTIKLQRIATIKAARGNGYATALINKSIKDSKEKGITDVVMSAQVHMIPYYENLGFNVTSDEFMQANIPHKMMGKTI